MRWEIRYRFEVGDLGKCRVIGYGKAEISKRVVRKRNAIFYTLNVNIIYNLLFGILFVVNR